MMDLRGQGLLTKIIRLRRKELNIQSQLDQVRLWTEADLRTLRIRLARVRRELTKCGGYEYLRRASKRPIAARLIARLLAEEESHEDHADDRGHPGEQGQGGGGAEFRDDHEDDRER